MFCIFYFLKTFIFFYIFNVFTFFCWHWVILNLFFGSNFFWLPKYRYQTKFGVTHCLSIIATSLKESQLQQTDQPADNRQTNQLTFEFLELQLSKSSIDCPFSSAITLCQHLCTGCTVAPNRAIGSNDFLVKWPPSADLGLHQLT